MIYSRQRFLMSTRGIEELDSTLFTKLGRTPSKYVLSLAAVLLSGVGHGHPVKLTPLPDVLPPAPPGLVARLDEGKPLPGGRIYVSPQQFEKERRAALKLRGRK